MLPTVVVDDGSGALSPADDLRGCFDVRTGVLTTLERVAARVGVLGVVVPTSKAEVVRERHGGLVVNGPWPSGEVLVLSGRVPRAWRAAGVLRSGRVMVDPGSGVVVAAVVPGSRVEAVARGDVSGLEVVGSGEVSGDWARVMSRPWHVRSVRDACIAEDLGLLVPGVVEAGGAGGAAALGPGVWRIGGGEVAVEGGATVHPGVVLDASAGPILVRRGAVVRPGAVLIGPCAVLEGATVLERATIRGQTVIGPGCKVNGEVGGTIFQGFANKAHDGYLGDSWVGEWVNLGAGTTNSNLLNTYGEVIARATPGGRSERSGETFLGAILGDHVKTAICTRLMTGCVVGTGAMIATTAAASGCVPTMSWCTDEGRRLYRLEKFMEVARAMMGRRGVKPSAAYEGLLGAVHARSASGPWWGMGGGGS